MLGLLYAIGTVMTWGTRLVRSQNIRFRNQQIKTFYDRLCLPPSAAPLLGSLK